MQVKANPAILDLAQRIASTADSAANVQDLQDFAQLSEADQQHGRAPQNDLRSPVHGITSRCHEPPASDLLLWQPQSHR